jgi:hypothetical protein
MIKPGVPFRRRPSSPLSWHARSGDRHRANLRVYPDGCDAETRLVHAHIGRV